MSPILWAKLIASHGPDAQALPRVINISLTTMLGVPLKLIERIRFSRAIDRAQMPAPVFIIGHWRSGTTHLHNLLCRDQAFGYASYLHCGASGIFLGHEGYARRLLQSRLPTKRPMDEMALGVDEPAEEDLAMARLSPLSGYHCFFFPRDIERLFPRTILFQGLGPGELDAWEQRYGWFLRKVSLHRGGRPLVLKNPPHTARIPHLLRMFPGARFIHIVRNPLHVYASTVHLWRRLLPLWSLQRFDHVPIEEHVIEFYRRIMGRYLADRQLIPPGQLAELRFEDLEADPLGQVQRIYRALDLGDFDRSRPLIAAYLQTLQGYRKNTLRLENAAAGRVAEQWAFASREWGYA
jgi:omega-hydroxy-beta-dihydromenaquinone-9 sulfotransferase